MQIRRRRRLARAFDAATGGEALARPGMDSRTWASMALVVGTDDDPPVIFEDGQQLVQVQLEPSKLPALCRVAASIAGDGEAEFSPWVVGDEVLVVMPSGGPDSAIITGRLNNELDRFPTESVAGQDPTTNTFAFRRRRTAHVEEYAGPILLRSALTGAFLSIDEGGVFTVRATDGCSLQLGPDAMQMQGPQSETSPPRFILQVDMVGEHFLLQVGDAVMCLGSSSADPDRNAISVPTALSLGTAGNAPLEHVATTEGVANFFAAFLAIYGTTLGVPAPAVDAAVAALVAAAATSAPYSTLTATHEALALAFSAGVQKQATGQVQLRPGLGCGGLLVG
jgi:hypothetical protein